MWVALFALFCLVACWWVGDLLLSTKVILTLLYLLAWLLLLIPNHAYLFVVAQCFLVAVIGGATFGTEWLMKRR